VIVLFAPNSNAIPITHICQDVISDQNAGRMSMNLLLYEQQFLGVLGSALRRVDELHALVCASHVF